MALRKEIDREKSLKLLRKLTGGSRLTEKDVNELSLKIKKGIANAHERRK